MLYWRHVDVDTNENNDDMGEIFKYKLKFKGRKNPCYQTTNKSRRSKRCPHILVPFQLKFKWSQSHTPKSVRKCISN